MLQFYEQGNKEIIRPELLGKEAETAAKKVGAVSRTQMRRIFNQIKSLDMRLEKGERWESIAPLVQLMKARIAYTVKRGKEAARKPRQGEIPTEQNHWDNLQRILNEGIDSIKNQNDYRAFVKYFEAVYAYFYANTN